MTIHASSRGFTLFETLIATGILVTALAGLAQLLVLSTHLTRQATASGAALVSAQDKLESLRGLPFSFYDADGAAITDLALQISPPDALEDDDEPYVDWVNDGGVSLESEGSSGIRASMAGVASWGGTAGSDLNRGVRLQGAGRSPWRGCLPVDNPIEAAMKGQGGFTVLELLVAMTIVVLLAGAMASAAPSASAAFDRVPAELDQLQRGRHAIDSLAQALRSASSIANPGDPGMLTVLVPIANGGRAVLAVDQDGPLLTLAAAPCPSVNVCGFTAGVLAVISDGIGRYDVLSVDATTPAQRRLTADSALVPAYPAGSSIVAIDQYTYRLASQADGSDSLVRETAAGAIQPMVDFVRDLSFTISGNEVDVSLRVEAATALLRRVLPDRVFKTAVRIRNVP